MLWQGLAERSAGSYVQISEKEQNAMNEAFACIGRRDMETAHLHQPSDIPSPTPLALRLAGSHSSWPPKGGLGMLHLQKTGRRRVSLHLVDISAEKNCFPMNGSQLRRSEYEVRGHSKVRNAAGRSFTAKASQGGRIPSFLRSTRIHGNACKRSNPL